MKNFLSTILVVLIFVYSSNAAGIHVTDQLQETVVTVDDVKNATVTEKPIRTFGKIVQKLNHMTGFMTEMKDQIQNNTVANEAMEKRVARIENRLEMTRD